MYDFPSFRQSTHFGVILFGPFVSMVTATKRHGEFTTDRKFFFFFLTSTGGLLPNVPRSFATQNEVISKRNCISFSST